MATHRASHQGFLSSQFAWGKDWNLETNIYYRGQLFAEDANAVSVDSAEVVHLYLSKKVSWLGLKLLPTLGIQNVLNDRYSDNVRINAFGGRYYEAAPRTYLSLRFTFNSNYAKVVFGFLMLASRRFSQDFPVGPNSLGSIAITINTFWTGNVFFYVV